MAFTAPGRATSPTGNEVPARTTSPASCDKPTGGNNTSVANPYMMSPSVGLKDHHGGAQLCWRRQDGRSQAGQACATSVLFVFSLLLFLLSLFGSVLSVALI